MPTFWNCKQKKTVKESRYILTSTPPEQKGNHSVGGATIQRGHRSERTIEDRRMAASPCRRKSAIDHRVRGLEAEGSKKNRKKEEEAYRKRVTPIERKAGASLGEESLAVKGGKGEEKPERWKRGEKESIDKKASIS